jgi:hypothetical protein
MNTVISYVNDTYGISTIGDVTWSHAVNSREKLGRTINQESIMFIESDIRVSSGGEIVCAHPPATESDLSFDDLVNQMTESKQGLKLDFKDPEILIPCLQKLHSKQLTQPVLLNADILKGNGANISKFSVVGFMALTQQHYPRGVLSIGWTTLADSEFPYTAENIDEMLSFSQGLEEVTYPVRACLLPNSWNELSRLIRKIGHTLSIWNNEPLDTGLQNWIHENTDPTKTFYDFIDENKEPLRFW